MLRRLEPYGFVLPTVVLMVVLMLVPIVACGWLATAASSLFTWILLRPASRFNRPLPPT